MTGRWFTTFAALLGIAIPGLWVLSLATPGEEAVKIRNALVASVGEPADFTWTPQQLPDSFLVNHRPPAPEFVAKARQLVAEGAGPPRQGLDLAVAISRHLMGAPKQVGGPLQTGLEEAYQGITRQGRGYCADFTQVFTGLAVAAGLPVRTWSISFETFGAGHTFNEIYDNRLGKWVLMDPFHSLYFMDAATLEPLSVLEVHERMLGAHSETASIAIHRIVPERFPFPSDEAAIDYYRLGMSQLALSWGNNVFDYDQSEPVRWSAAVSRHAERLVAIAVGQYPDLRIYPKQVSARDLRGLEGIRSRFLMASAAFVIACGVFGWLLWTVWRRRLPPSVVVADSAGKTIADGSAVPGGAQPRSGAVGTRNTLASLLVVALVLLGWAYRETIVSIIQKWRSDAAFSHGFLILPISLWLAWRKRDALAQIAWQPSILGVIAALLCTLAWVVARGSGVLVIEQAALVAMIPSLVLAARGWRATRVLLVPLAFLIFMVPFGRALVPFLMQVTADFATLLLEWSAVPVLRSHMYISIPDGNFEVARACSGLNYFITSLVLGCLYAYLNYRGWFKRAVCVLAFVVIPVVLNGLRVYLTILVSHWTHMRFGPGVEHVTFGRIFFVVVMLLLFWIGKRWQESPVRTTVATGAAGSAVTAPWISWWPLPLAFLIVISGPPFVERAIAETRTNLLKATKLVAFPSAPQGWDGPSDGAGRWRPLYRGGMIEQQALYLDSSGVPVDVFVAAYGLGATVGPEMIAYANVISASERGSLARDGRRELGLHDGTSLVVRELVVEDAGVDRLVWHWYVVGDQPAVSQFAVKAREAIAFVTGSAELERVVTVSTMLDRDASERLRAFVEANGVCVAQGFSAEACGG